MKKVQAIIVIAGLLFSLTANAENKQANKETNKIAPLPRDLEIQLALSALPPNLRENATVYVLNPDKGFEVARKGTNAFLAFVARTGDDTFRGSWPLTEYRDDILYPISFDSAGAKAQMRVFFDAAEMQAEGTPPGELKKIIQERFRTGYYIAPERAGVSYMLSPILRTYVNPDESDSVATISVPHVMYYAPYVSNEDIGGEKPGIPPPIYPFVIMPGPHGYIVQLLGVTEGAAIKKEYEEMLARLCNIKKVWCLPKEKGHIIHIVIFKYKPDVSPEKRSEIARRFLELKSLAKKDGKNYIVSIAGGKAVSREGFDQGLEEAFIVTFRNEADRDYFVGKPYSSIMDPAHAALAAVVEPLLSADGSGKLKGLFVFDFIEAAQ